MYLTKCTNMFYWWERGEYYGRKFELLPLILVRGGGGEYDHHSLACHTPPIPPLIVHSSIGNSMIILNGETRREKKGGAHLHVPPYSI